VLDSLLDNKPDIDIWDPLIKEPLPPDRVETTIAPEMIKQVNPQFPSFASQMRMEGTVWVKIAVGTAGKPIDVRILKSENEAFNEAAIEAAARFEFTPAYLDDKPVATWVSIPIRFFYKRKQ
jgi:protein TonB